MELFANAGILKLMTLIYFLIILAVLIGGFVALFLFMRKGAQPKDETQGMILLQQQLQKLTDTVDSKLGESQKEMRDSVQNQFSESKKLLSEISEKMKNSLLDVTKEQTKTNEATRQFMTIAEQLSNLEKVLKHQKQRGNLGEASLELILANILPPGAYKMQYRFKNNDAVDAVIVTKEGIIPVDAKFSLDNYNRVTMAIDDKQREELEKDFKNDLKKRIDETSKYIRTDEGTLPFAFMFIPAEGIYYDLLVNEVGAVKVNTRNLIDYAYNEKKVIIVSPTTFAAYLQSVLYGFKAFKIEERAQEITKWVEDLGRHLLAYEGYIEKLGNALGTTVNHFNTASKELKKVDKDVVRITGQATGIETRSLEKPLLGEE
jgi:DNA recombination protein RmuC